MQSKSYKAYAVMLVSTSANSPWSADLSKSYKRWNTLQASILLSTLHLIAAIRYIYPLDDAFTQELVAKFYDNLRSPRSKAEALQEVQKALINQNKKIHPAQWAPFILIGNWL